MAAWISARSSRRKAGGVYMARAPAWGQDGAVVAWGEWPVGGFSGGPIPGGRKFRIHMETERRREGSVRGVRSAAGVRAVGMRGGWGRIGRLVRGV
jgi:hypothetical protein